MDKDNAKDYAIEALLWLSKNKNCLEAFLIWSGSTVVELQGQSKNPDFLLFVLDFFMTSDDLILNLSEGLETSPEQLQVAHTVLSGDDLRYWT